MVAKFDLLLTAAGMALPLVAAAQAPTGQVQQAPGSLDIAKFNADAPEGKVFDKATKTSYRVIQAPVSTYGTAHVENSGRTADTRTTIADGIFNIGQGVKVPFPAGPLDTLHFDHNVRNTSNAASQSHLDRLALLLVEHPAAEFSVKGYADQSGDTLYNAKLAMDRAQTTVNSILQRANEFCEQRGLPPIDSARVTVISSFGENAPLVEKTQTNLNDKYELELREEQNRFTAVSLHWNPEKLQSERQQIFLFNNKSNTQVTFNLGLTEAARTRLEAAHPGEHYAVADGHGAILFDADINTKKPVTIKMADMTPANDGNVLFGVHDDGAGKTFRFHHDKTTNKVKVQVRDDQNRWGNIAEIDPGMGNPAQMQFGVLNDQNQFIPLKLDERGCFSTQKQQMATVDMAKPASVKTNPNDIPAPFRRATKEEQLAFGAQLAAAVEKGTANGLGFDHQQAANGKGDNSFGGRPEGGNTFPVNHTGNGTAPTGKPRTK